MGKGGEGLVQCERYPARRFDSQVESQSDRRRVRAQGAVLVWVPLAIAARAQIRSGAHRRPTRSPTRVRILRRDRSGDDVGPGPPVRPCVDRIPYHLRTPALLLYWRLLSTP